MSFSETSYKFTHEMKVQTKVNFLSIVPTTQYPRHRLPPQPVDSLLHAGATDDSLSRHKRGLVLTHKRPDSSLHRRRFDSFHLRLGPPARVLDRLSHKERRYCARSMPYRLPSGQRLAVRGLWPRARPSCGVHAWYFYCAIKHLHELSLRCWFIGQHSH